MKKQKTRLVVLDAHAIIHRAYHALPSFVNKDGKPTGAIYGLFNMIIKIANDFKPDYLVACFDLPKKTFRHEVYSDYKGKRAKSDPELIEQFKSAKDLLVSLSIPIYEKEGFEADDLIGTIVEKTKNQDLEVIIASGDMDTLQLVEKGDRVKVFTLRKGINDTAIFGYNDVSNKYGFKAELIPDYKGLRGDPSDNIIGIKGIGDKTATDLLIKFGSIENIYQKLHKNPNLFKESGFSDRIIKLLQDSQEEAEFSKLLAIIRKDAEMNFSLNTFWLESIDLIQVEKFCEQNDFKKPWQNFLKLIPEKNYSKKTEQVENYDPEDLKKISIMAWLIDSDKSDFDYEGILDLTKTSDLKKAEIKIKEMLVETNQFMVWQEIEEPIIPIVKEMTKKGVLVDINYLNELLEDYQKLIKSYEDQICTLAGKDFNVRSPKQVSEILFVDLKLPTKGIKKNPSGGFSTNEENLEKLLGLNPIIPLLLSHRELCKIVSTYLEVLPNFLDKDNRIHAEFLQAGTSTGRFSSQNPNLQNIPIKSDWGVKIRKAFIAPSGYKLATFDYSQIELRIAGIMSSDKYLEKVFSEGLDIHTAVASKIFNVGLNEVSREMRSKAKTINFGVLYGMGVSALQKNLGVSRIEAQQFYNAFFENFTELTGWFEHLKKTAKQKGYSETLFGRRRYLPGLRSSIPFIKAMAERIAVNAPIQGTATADIIKLAIRQINEQLVKNNFKKDVSLVLQIHDELVYEIKDEVLDVVIPIIRKTMEDVLINSYLHLKTKIPLLVNGGSGQNWLSGK